MNEKLTIYGLINPIDDTCFYVGQTKKGLNDRLRQHINDKKDNYYKRKIINDIINSGLKPIIEEIISIEDYYIPELDINYWQYVEMYCMIYIKDVLKHPLTNIATGGWTCWDNKRNKKIKQYDLNGNYIKTYISIAVAARTFKDKDFETSNKSIGNCCRGKSNTSYGYQWCYVGNEDKIVNNVSILRKEYDHSPEVAKRLKIKEDLMKKKREEIVKRKEYQNTPEAIELRRLKHIEKVKRSNNTEASIQRRKENKKKYYQTPEGKEKKRLEVQRYKEKLKEDPERYEEFKRKKNEARRLKNNNTKNNN